MNDRVMQFRVGLVVLASLILGGILAMLNSPLPKDWIPWGEGTYQVTIELERAPAIGPNVPVRKNGLLIGRVASVKDMVDHVAVTVNVDKGLLLYPQYDAEVHTSVMGDATIEFVSRPVPPDTPPLEDGAVVKGTVIGSPLEALTNLQGDLKRMIASFQHAGDEVGKLAERVNRAMGDETDKGRITRMLDNTEIALQKFTQTADTVHAFFNDPYLKQLSKDAHNTMSSVQDAAEVVENMATSAQKNLKNLEGFTEPLGRRGEDIAAGLVDGLTGLGRIVEELTVLTEALNNRQGTIGQLIHNPQVYDNLNRLLQNANHVVLRFNALTKRLQVVVEDARIFMYKIAVEPGRLIGGALNKGPGIK